MPWTTIKGESCTLVESRGEPVDDELCSGLSTENDNIARKDFPEGSFQWLCWNEQNKGVSVNGVLT